jgi:hypothetical protein
MSEAQEFLSIACPYCGMGVGYGCRVISAMGMGRRAPAHRARLRAWARKQTAEWMEKEAARGA